MRTDTRQHKILFKGWTTVKKIGRKYFYVEGHRNRFNIATMEEADRYSPELKAYLSEDIFNEYINKKDAIHTLLEKINSGALDEIPLGKIREIISMLE